MADIFGTDPGVPDFAQDEPAPEVTEATPETPEIVEETTVVEEPVEVVTEETTSEEATPEETPPGTEAEAQERAWAGKYKSPEELERGYRELRDLQRRTAERANVFESRSTEMEAQKQQLETALRQAAPYIQQAMVQAQQEQQFAAPGEQPGIRPEQVDYIVQQRLAQFQQTQAAQQEAANQIAEASFAMQNFFEAHPEVEPRSEIDSDIASTIVALNEAWAPSGSAVDISNRESLEIAYEATKRPALRQVLELHPEYIDTDTGVELARKLASELDGGVAVAPQTTRTQVSSGKTPVVERGSSQAPPSGQPLDDFDAAVAEYRSARSRGGGDVFFS